MARLRAGALQQGIYELLPFDSISIENSKCCIS